MIDNLQLVEYAKKALNEKWGYVWGTFGQLLTPDLFAAKVRQYPGEVGQYFDFIKNNYVGKKTADCVGLIKSAYWSESGELRYSSSTDVSADNMFNIAAIKGDMSNMPDVPGLCLWKRGHIGIYIGNGLVIEANSTLKGVIQTPLLGAGRTPWTNWLQCPMIRYESEEETMIKLPDNWNDQLYLEKNLDVKQAVENGTFKDGADHWTQYGYRESNRFWYDIISVKDFKSQVIEFVNKL